MNFINPEKYLLRLMLGVLSPSVEQDDMGPEQDSVILSREGCWGIWFSIGGLTMVRAAVGWMPEVLSP